ncbi:hypothetical protein HCJ58_00970 [Listeria sp. FSL L7-1509]|uniref:Uncharacterized protein n=1 Tax=Listeria immobilis TaxID=2713502 RepID=A0ABR6STL2_9LIST|nr:hypothetical protein [Listeria immobilis]MBC1505558.1 hypothetical protein [Listeria immobilis]MBC1509008.1 hypothetical protein [Listeria immobilis]MBC6312382.1 hypothetical protein [Listeria immobilis]HAC1155077.1 hypothetical protein [Listeria monocytogenes]
MNRARRFCHKVDPTDSQHEQLNKLIIAIDIVTSEYAKIKTIIMRRLEKGQHINTDIIEYYNDLRWVRLNLLYARIEKEDEE